MERLLQDDLCPAPSTSRQPTWNQDQVLFDSRMEEEGFERSKTQPQTPPDGDCALWGILDGYNSENLRTESLYDREETLLLR